MAHSLPRRMYLFASIFALFTLCICAFTTFIFIHSFAISGHEAFWLYTLALFISFAFILAFATSRDSALTGRNAFYIFAMTLGGYGMYLFIMSIPLAIILAVFSATGSTMPLWTPIILFALALLLGVIGHVQSWIITTTRYTVTIPDLPGWWHAKTAVLVTDTHFGLVRKEKFARAIVKKIQSLAPDIIFHGGDFYDGPDITLDALTAIWKTLAEKIPTFYAPGNHEAYGNYASFMESIRNASITVLEDKMTTYQGMQIAGITYRPKKDVSQAATAINYLDIDKAIPTILINHPPTFHDVMESAGISLMLSGHTHNGQFWPGSYIARLVYGRYTYGLKTYITMHTITSRGVGTAGPPMRLWNSPELVVIEFKNKE